MLVACSVVFLAFAPQKTAAKSTASQVIDIAKRYSDSPYRYGGTSPHSGFDCSGFTQFVFNKAGIDLNRTSGSQYSQGDYVSRSNLQKGDLVFFGSPVWHVGIYIGNNKMISAENASTGIQVTSLTDYWDRNYTGAKRVIEEQAKDSQSAESKPLPVGQYHDVPNGHWAADKIEKLSKQGIIEGYNERFNPDDKVTRAEAAKMLSVALDLPKSPGNDYTDVNSPHWASEYINSATNKGYFDGYDNGRKFKPEQPITRAEIAALFKEAFNLNGSGKSFADTKGHWGEEDIQALTAHSIAKGYSANAFKPDAATKRSEFAVFLTRALN
nr:C40 family peptidase [Thalassobacillus sp. CUG 92003]